MPICNECGHEFADLVPWRDFRFCPECFAARIVTCVDCRENLDLDDAIVAFDQSPHCQPCYASYYTHCRNCGIEVGRDCCEWHHDNPYCSSCYERRFVPCYNCGTSITRSESYSTPSGDRCCHDCFSESCGVCDNCGDTHWNDDLHSTGDGMRCNDCYRGSDEWESSEFVVSEPHYDTLGSTRQYGIELETSDCEGFRDLRGNTIWECKTDCSIEGREFVSPILHADEGLTEIETFCAIARRKRWHIDRYCGYHLHLDVSSEPWQSLKSIAYAYRKLCDMWRCLVSEQRANNPYCGAPDYSLDTVERINSASDWEYFVGARDRFEFINWRAYLVHGSCEVRSHDATLDAEVICNWIKIHARFMDCVKGMATSEIDEKFGCDIETNFAALEDVVGEELWVEYAEIAEEYGHRLRHREMVALSPPF